MIVLFKFIDSKPIGYTSVTKITSWWPITNIAKSIGVPGYANTDYNYFSFGLWTCGGAPGAMAAVF